MMNWTDEELEEAMREAEASLNVEGLYTTEEENELIRMQLRGEISEEEFKKRIYELIQS